MTGRLRRATIGGAWVLPLLCAVLVWTASPASAADSDEEALAEQYAPRARLMQQPEACGPGEPYRPNDVDRLWNASSVALRGPWQQADLVEVGPAARTLAAGLPRYALDYPGNPLKPGCSYEEWAEDTWAGSPSTVYAHVATEAAEPGRLALQYWFYYPYNDFNNKHEGDWEMIQVEFDAPDAKAALGADPVTVVYSQHEGAERAAWDGEVLERADGSHPVVYVSAGSHASHFDSALFLLRSGEQGFGCDSTLDPGPEDQLAVRTIPADPSAATAAFPWIGYEGLWGQRESLSIYSGPTGPSAKDRWTEPFTWSAEAGDQSYAVPGGEVYGVKTTEFFCGIVEQGSLAVLRFTADPWPVLGILAAALLVVIWLVRRAAWGTSQPAPVWRERGFGEVVAVAWSLYRTRWRLFLGIGSVVALVSLGTSLLAQLASGSLTGSTAEVEADPAPLVVAATAIGVPLLLVMVLLAQGATVQALERIAAGEAVGVRVAYRLALGRAGALAGTAVVWGLVIGALALTIYLAPISVLLVVGWGVFVPVTQLEGLAGVGALRRSWRLVRPQFVKVAALLTFGGLLTGLIGGLAGVLPLLVAQVPFLVVNLIPGVVAALLGPFTSLLMAYAYAHGLAAEASRRDDGVGYPAGAGMAG